MLSVRPPPNPCPVEEFRHGQANARAASTWGSDVLAEMLRRLGVKYVVLNPGSSFRRLHDSLVNDDLGLSRAATYRRCTSKRC